MKNIKVCEFGKEIKKKLVDLDQTQEWLIEQVKADTGLFFDSSYLHKILTGKKTIEIRKSMPKCNLPIDVYLYCTYGQLLVWDNDDILGFSGYYLSSGKVNSIHGYGNQANGKIVAKFTLNKVGKFKVEFLPLLQEMGYVNPYTLTVYDGSFKTMFLEQNSCLLLEDIYKYNENRNSYAWHIDNLEIFKKPMELREFYRNNFQVIQDYEPCNNYDCIYTVDNSILGDDGYCPVDECPRLRISRPPMSWEYAYKEE